MVDIGHRGQSAAGFARGLAAVEDRLVRRVAPRRAERRFLFIGGPCGPFFRCLGDALEQRGYSVFRINLHAADAIHWRTGTRFNRSPAEWRNWLAQYFAEHCISDLVVFGDCQFYNRIALDVARSTGAERHVFEAGYFRPDWVTYEKGGVNGYSSLPRNREVILKEGGKIHGSAIPHEKIGTITPYHVMYAVLDNMIDFAGRVLFRRYRWPHLHGPLSQAVGTVARIIRLQILRGRQKRELQALRNTSQPYYLCLLQRDGDSQILFHSAFGSVTGFCELVMKDFARNAPPGTLLVFKNHPLDPGIDNYRKRIRRLARALHIESRVWFFDGGNLAELAKPARGVITINSTAGISTIQYSVPTLALGNAIYNLPGLTHQGDLESFWENPQRPDMELFRAFHHLVLTRTQINGNYYSPRGRRLALEACADRLVGSPAHAAEALRAS